MAEPTGSRKLQIKAVLFIEDLAPLIGMSVRTLYHRIKHNTLPRELRPLPAVGRKHRWSGREVATKYLRLTDADFEIIRGEE